MAVTKSETESFSNHWSRNKFMVRLCGKWYFIEKFSKNYDNVLKSFPARTIMPNAINEAHPSRLKVSFSLKK